MLTLPSELGLKQELLGTVPSSDQSQSTSGIPSLRASLSRGARGRKISAKSVMAVAVFWRCVIKNLSFVAKLCHQTSFVWHDHGHGD